MISSDAQGMGATTFAYDGEGRRVWKSGSAGITAYGYDASVALTAEYSTQPSLQTGTEYMSADHLGATTGTHSIDSGSVFEIEP